MMFAASLGNDVIATIILTAIGAGGVGTKLVMELIATRTAKREQAAKDAEAARQQAKTDAEAQAALAVARSRDDTAKHKLDKQERDRDTTVAERQLERAYEELNRLNIRNQQIEADRDKTAATNISLIEENAKLAFEKIELTERVSMLETRVNRLIEDVRECHEVRDQDKDERKLDLQWMRDVFDYMRRNYVPRDGTPPEGALPPRPRSVTPPATPRIDVVKKE